MTAITPRHSFPQTPAFLIVLVIWTASGNTGFAAATTGTTVKAGVVSTSEAVFPKSVFAYRAGKDPFFPDLRWEESKPIADGKGDQKKQEDMVLRGIAGSSDRRVVLINGHPLKKGEVREIKAGTNTFKIRVIEIKEKSVIIEREGQPGPTELPLRDDVLPIKKEE
jgi:hypothetical protein